MLSSTWQLPYLLIGLNTSTGIQGWNSHKNPFLVLLHHLPSDLVAPANPVLWICYGCCERCYTWPARAGREHPVHTVVLRAVLSHLSGCTVLTTVGCTHSSPAMAGTSTCLARYISRYVQWEPCNGLTYSSAVQEHMSRVLWPHPYHFFLLVLKPSLGDNSPFESLTPFPCPSQSSGGGSYTSSAHTTSEVRGTEAGVGSSNKEERWLLPEAPNCCQTTRCLSFQTLFLAQISHLTVVLTPHSTTAAPYSCNFPIH